MKCRSACIAGLLFAALAPAQELQHDRTSSLPQELRQVREAWLQNFNAKNRDGVLRLYDEGATLVSEAGTFHGREAIRPWIQQSIDQGSRIESIDATVEKNCGTLAYSTGGSRRWVGSELHLGQYLIVMEKIGDDWKIVQHFSMNVRAKGTR